MQSSCIITDCATRESEMTKAWMKIVVAGRRKGRGLMTETNVPQGDAFNDFMCCILIHRASDGNFGS